MGDGGLAAVEVGDGLEDGGEDQIHHAANQNGHDDEDYGGDECHEAGDGFAHLAVVPFGGAAPGDVDFSGLLADGYHVDEEGWEGTAAGEGFGDGAAIADLADDSIEVLAHDEVAGGIA